MVTTLAIGQGVPRLSKYVWTANMVEAFQYTKAFEIIPYQNQKQLRRGDALLAVTRHHVVEVIKGYDDAAPVYSTVPKWIGEAYGMEIIPVYVDPTATKQLPSWPNLGVGNLFDVCDETGNYYYIRIAGKYFGWIEKRYVLRKTEYTTGVVTTDLHMRANAGTKYRSLMVLPKNTTVKICDIKKAENGADWYHIFCKGIYGFCSAKYVKLK